jgi:hypothetical protein
MPVVAEDSLEDESHDGENPSVTINETESDGTYTTNRGQESSSVYTRDDGATSSEYSHSISSKQESVK